MLLKWHGYRYYPYERELATREAAALFRDQRLREVPDGVELAGENDNGLGAHLVYFSGLTNGHGTIQTLQNRLESTAQHGKSRQATRYSVHGLHEYKGKFNPQVVRALLNIFGVTSGQRVLDPFCGSGTTLVECAHTGVLGYGVDINPFAVFMANAKLQALVTPVDDLRAILRRLSISLKRTKTWRASIADNPRSHYLRSWFDQETLQTIEIMRDKIENIAETVTPVFLAIASNLLRDYSLQDPKDLRIRRRRSPLPDTPFPEAFVSASAQALERLEATQAILGTDLSPGQAVLHDVATLASAELPVLFDAAITSPPYAMALPYIDTQRLSLVWLNLLEPERIACLEAELIGSREFRGSSRRTQVSALESNADCLPEAEVAFCQRLLEALDERDGFRRQAVPTLLYRYFAAMQRGFRAIRGVTRPRAPFALIVGHNHSVLGGIRYDINTPEHLAGLAKAVGWTVEELLPLQTYHRYGYHMSNAVSAETLIILRNSK